MLKLNNVSKKISSFQLENISFKLPKGYIMGLIGENGAGKTTLINILSGLYSKNDGTISFNGKSYDTEESDIKQDIGTIIHEELFERKESLIKNANRYGRFYKNYDEELLKNYLIRFNLDGKKKYKRLSKGEKLKFALAFALSHQPKLLLLDEPTANLDTDFRKEFQKVLREFTESGENSVILSTHLTADIEKYADYLLFLKKGKQVLFGDIESIRGGYRIVGGEAYKIKLLKDRIIHMEDSEFGCKALVRKSHKPYDTALKVREPTIEELMYHMVKGGEL